MEKLIVDFDKMYSTYDKINDYINSYNAEVENFKKIIESITTEIWSGEDCDNYKAKLIYDDNSYYKYFKDVSVGFEELNNFILKSYKKYTETETELAKRKI